VVFFFFLFTFKIAIIRGFGSNLEDNEILPIDPQFSDNACILIESYTPPDCSRAPPDRFRPDDEGPDPCPGCPDEEDDEADEGIQLPLQVQYNQLEDAIENCPYDPVLIEFTGTIYLTNDPYLWYNGTKDVIIRGLSQTIETGGQDIITLVPMNVSSFNATTNTTTIMVELVEVITQSPIVNQTFDGTIVGLKDWQILHDNVSFTFDNVVLEGCNTKRGIFLTEVKPERCGFPEPPIECCGAYFPTDVADKILNEGVCQRTAADFDGYRAFVENSLINPSPWRFQTEVTVEAWIRPDVPQKRFTGIVGKFVEDDDEEESGWGFAWADPIDDGDGTQSDAVWWLIGSNGDFSRIKAPTPMGQWTHIAGTFDNGVSRVYVNGQLYDERTGLPNDIDYDRARDFAIGRGADFSDEDDDDYEYFEGSLDEVRIWNVARTEAQIQATYRTTVDPLNPDLFGYFRFDTPHTGEVDNYDKNLVAVEQAKPELGMLLTLTSGGGPSGNTGNPHPHPVCFCPEEHGLCTATDLFVEFPPDAIIGDFGGLCGAEEESCKFVHGMVIDPNEDFGNLWLPGLKEISGPIFNETERFIPGKFFQQQVFVEIMVYNATTNTTTTELVPAPGNLTEPIFVPGAVPSQLPPLGVAAGNPWWYIDEFIPGWFANDGMVPYWALNFFPGIFVNASDAMSMYGVPLPTEWEEGDLVFIPGLELNSTGFIPFSIFDPLYITPIVEFGGFTFNFVNDTEPCTIPTSPPQEEEEMLEPMENKFGCTVGPDDPEPFVLDPANRDPCFVLRDIRLSLPEGTESLAAEDVLGCNAGPDDPEPFYLDPSQRDPCFILRDLRMQLGNYSTFAENCTKSGGEPLEPIYISCLRNQNLTIVDSTIRNYLGDRVMCQWACEEYVTLEVTGSSFEQTPGSAIWSSGLHNYDINNNKFCPCGGQTEACVYLNANHISRGEFAIWNNRHCAIEDNLPINCDYDITPTLRCVNGVMQCLDIAQTLLDDCQQVEIAEGVVVFDSDCSVYAPCTCESSMVNVTLGNGEVVEQEIFDGDLNVNIPFLTPDLEQLVDGNNTLTLNCQLQNETFEYTYVCQEIITVNITLPPPMDNITLLVNVTVDTNCTDTVIIMSGSLDALPCPCPEGFNANFTTNSTGSQAAGNAGLYQECEWAIPDGLPGEFCLDTVVQCPFEGGTLGTGDPPPVPPETCSNGMALVSCNEETCINGTLYYEGVFHPCNLGSGSCMTDGFIQVSCLCDDMALTVPCIRDVSCIPQTPCINNTLCLVVDGLLTFDGVDYLCAILTNQTNCVGATYAPGHPVPSDGLLTLPCDNSYNIPGPGPCSCLGDVTLGGLDNMTIPAIPAPMCNFTIDPNCTEPIQQPVDTGMEALQLICNPNGQLTCRCDGFQSFDITVCPNRSLLNTSAAFYIDHVPPDASLWFQRSNVAQQLPFGWRYERFGLRLDSGWDLLNRFALKVLHFFTGEGIMHESSRISPLITGSIQDWVQGHPQQWNRRVCTNGCHQSRPRQLFEACVVNQDYGPQTPDFETLRYNRIQPAIENCGFDAVVVQKGENVFEETIDIRRSNFWLGSYDRAVIVASDHGIRGNNITLRGVVWVHPNTNPFPVFSPTGESEFFDTADDDDDGVTPPNNFTLLNNEIIGDGVNEAGAVVGPLGSFFRLAYNTIRNFFTRTIDIEAVTVDVELNRWILTTGRAFRARNVYTVRFDENLLEECVGISEGENVDIVSIEAFGDLGTITTTNLAAVAFQAIFGNGGDAEQADQLFDIPDLDPDRGCNTDTDPSRTCVFRGNIQSVSLDQPDQSSVTYRFIGGNMPVENFHSNVANHGRFGALFTHTSGILFTDRSEIFKTNALVRTKFTRQIQDDAEDFGFTAPGSLVILGCSFPDCLSFDEQYPMMESNPRHDLNRVEEYGFRYIHNVTDCNIFSLTLNQCSVTSERARLRREDIRFFMDFWAVGLNDLNCCDKPVIYGNHVILADRTILEFIEFRYEYDTIVEEESPHMFRTLDEFNAFQIIFNKVCLDGRYFIGTEDRVRVMDVFMRVEDGEFVFQNSLVYNFWHYPEGTQLGFIDDPRGAVGVVILPDGTVFLTERSPDVDGIFVHFTKHRRINLSPFVVVVDEEGEPITSTNGFGQQLDLTPDQIATQDGRIVRPVEPPSGDGVFSFASFINNTFMDFDGRVISIHQPANWEIVKNIFINCGMRQYEEIALVDLEGNVDSLGDYICENNIANQSKPFLFPIGGGQGNKVRFACWEVHGFGRPRIWTFRNNTCQLLTNQTDTGVFSTSAELAVADGEVSANANDLSGIFSSDGINLLGLNDATTDDVPSFDGTTDSVLGTTLRPQDVFSANANQETAESSKELNEDNKTGRSNGINQFSINPTERGFTIGLRLYDIDRDTMAKTLIPGTVNTTLFPFFQPGLYPLRIIASAMNSIDAMELLALGNITADQLPTNGPGIQGLNADIIYCNTYGDVMQGFFAECAICNDACPVLPPDTCIVDPQNDTFVVENAYYNTWLFTSINQAVLSCVDPLRQIELRNQNIPFTQTVDIRAGNWTIFSSDLENPAEINVGVHSILLNAGIITFQNIIFTHAIGNLQPTIKPGTAIMSDVSSISFINCTFNGDGTKNSAVSGQFDSIAFESTIFMGYDGARVLDLTSSCGSLIIENSEFFNAKGAAIYAEEYDFIIIRRNIFDQCGGQWENELACVYVRSCVNTVVEFIFAGNEHFFESDDDYDFERTGDFTPQGYVAAYWLDGLPITSPNTTIDLEGNAASGLPIGIRSTRIDFINSNVGIDDKRATVQWIYIINRNLAVDGTWYDVVVGEPIDDQTIMDDPTGTSMYWWNSGESASTQASGLVIFLAILAGILLVYCFVTCKYRIAKAPSGQFYSTALDDYLPSRWEYW